MKEFIQYIEFIESIVTRYYEKRQLSYDFEKGEWYSRYHSRILNVEDVLEWVESLINLKINKIKLNFYRERRRT